jgi:hypothetical protein
MSTSNQCSSKYWAQISPFVLYTLKTFLRFFQVNGKMVYGFWNSHSRIIEDSGLLRCDTESLGNLLRTFRKNLSSLSWTASDPWTSESEPRPTICSTTVLQIFETKINDRSVNPFHSPSMTTSPSNQTAQPTVRQIHLLLKSKSFYFAYSVRFALLLRTTFSEWSL